MRRTIGLHTRGRRLIWCCVGGAIIRNRVQTHGQAEHDAVDCIALEDLGLEQVAIIYPGRKRFPIAPASRPCLCHRLAMAKVRFWGANMTQPIPFGKILHTGLIPVGPDKGVTALEVR